MKSIALKASNGKYLGLDSTNVMASVEIRFVLSTRPLKASTISWWGKCRWLSCGLV
ncbi:hypothetical protein [Scytonema sp. PRP1]|uniref:hypothetical protein n=1 Tax=Scytonema sp. PRP1 TaxID=3120513 RepID=UPI002FD2DA69